MEPDKKTALDNDAEIYQARPKKTYKQNTKFMTFKEKIAYFLEYYKYITLAIVLGLALIIYIIISVLKPKINPILNITFINNPFSEERIENLNSDLFNYFKIDPKTETLDINTTFYFSKEDEFELRSRQILSTFIMASEVDILIAPESETRSHVIQEVLTPLSDLLPSDLYDKLKEHLFISNENPSNPHETAYGIYLNSTDMFKDINDKKDPYIVSVVLSSHQKDNAVEFIKYLFDK